jgi:hypothetical protein
LTQGAALLRTFPLRTRWHGRLTSVAWERSTEHDQTVIRQEHRALHIRWLRSERRGLDFASDVLTMNDPPRRIIAICILFNASVV